jgi:hypothetical protein
LKSASEILQLKELLISARSLTLKICNKIRLSLKPASEILQQKVIRLSLKAASETLPQKSY